MSIFLQWIVVAATAVLVYKLCIYDYIRHGKVSRIKKGMTKKEVARLLGKPRVIKNYSSETVFIYKFSWVHRVNPEKARKVRVRFDKAGLVVSVDDSEL